MKLSQVFLYAATASLFSAMVTGIYGVIGCGVLITIGMIVDKKITKVLQESTDKRNNSHTDEL